MSNKKNHDPGAAALHELFKSFMSYTAKNGLGIADRKMDESEGGRLVQRAIERFAGAAELCEAYVKQAEKGEKRTRLKALERLISEMAGRHLKRKPWPISISSPHSPILSGLFGAPPYRREACIHFSAGCIERGGARGLFREKPMRVDASCGLTNCNKSSRT